MAILDAIIAPMAKLLDKIIPDPQARDRAKLELLKLQGDQEMQTIAVQMQAIVAEAQSADPWTSRARPSFLYVMYTLILWALPMGLMSAIYLSEYADIRVRRVVKPILDMAVSRFNAFARLSREQAVDVMHWSARALLQFALAESGASGIDAPANTGG